MAHEPRSLPQEIAVDSTGIRRLEAASVAIADAATSARGSSGASGGSTSLTGGRYVDAIDESDEVPADNEGAAGTRTGDGADAAAVGCPVERASPGGCSDAAGTGGGKGVWDTLKVAGMSTVRSVRWEPIDDAVGESVNVVCPCEAETEAVDPSEGGGGDVAIPGPGPIAEAVAVVESDLGCSADRASGCG